MLTLPNYQIQTQIYESANSLVYRGYKNENHQPVVFKVLKENYPTLEELTRYQQEYEITHNLDLAGVIKAYSLEKYQNTLVIILEDFGGESLKTLLSKNPSQPLFVKKASFAKDELGGILTFLTLAIQITESLAQIHTAHIIHKDINSTNIVWNPTTNILKIIDFGISSRLPREMPTLKNLNQLEGTLTYISPEQTGRMNRALDYRTDLYSLGVTFYELLTGQLPFNADNALELVHCHIAKTPKPVCELNSAIPDILSDIVMKLMAKNVEDRYQSAFGVKVDLEKCLENQPDFKNNLSFELAQQDFSGQFQIPQKLYGREKEVNILLQAFERISNPSPGSVIKDQETITLPKGRGELVLVAGYSGVGKTALVHEVYKPMTEKHGYFAAGKFDQYQRNIPYSAITQAFNKFCHGLLTESTVILKQWQNQILAKIGANGQVLIDVIPQLELIIGPQPAVAQVGPQEIQNRFNLVFQNFFQAISQPKHPFILFIDDLQWADSASLNLLKTLITDPKAQHFLIIGAYRNNEVNATHPLRLMVNELQTSQATVNTIELQNLSKADVNTLTTDLLNCERAESQALANLVYAKTQGNAFFTKEFLQSLYEQALLEFDRQTQTWQWNTAQIAHQEMTDNVVELMVTKLQKLPIPVQEVLKLAACIGNQFDLKTLNLIYQHPQQLLTHLWYAVEENLLFPLDDNYKVMVQNRQPEINSVFKFQHDRVQQAAVSLLTAEAKQCIHLQLGHLLLTGLDNWEERLFEIVDHLNLGLALITATEDKLELAKLNLEAGQKAKEATAYAAAKQYLTIGIANLTENSWETHYDLTLKLYQETADVEYLNGQFNQSETLIRLILGKAQASLDKAEVYKMLVVQYTLQAQYTEAIQVGREALRYLEVELPETDLKTAFETEVALAQETLGAREIATLIQQPKVIDAKIILTIKILRYIALPAYFSNQALWSVIIMKNVNFCLQYGHVPETSPTFCAYGMILGAIFQKYQIAYEFGLVAINVSERFNANKCQAYGMTGIFLMPWVKPLLETHSLCQQAYQAGLESGDLQYAGYISTWELFHCFYQGIELSQVLLEASISLSFTQETKNQFATDIIFGIQRIIFQLTATDEQPYLNEVEYLEKCQKHKNLMCLYAILQAQFSFLNKQPSKALEYAQQAEKHLAFIRGFISKAHHNFYYSLSLTALYPTASANLQAKFSKKLEFNQQQMQIWARHCPQNFQHLYLLVAAEMARIFGQDFEALNLYQQALEEAKKNNFIQNKALVHELLAQFWSTKDFLEYANLHLQEAYYNYQQWGATQKVKSLETQYPQLITKTANQFSPDLTMSQTQVKSFSFGGDATQFLDLNTVIKASQTLSEEIILSKLLKKMMLIVIENAGAEKGFLILPKNDQWLIEAESWVDKNEVDVLQSLAIHSRELVCATIIHYVARTREPVVLHDATHEGSFTHVPYIMNQQPQSILCTPLMNKGQLTAILYLENNLTTGAFTAARLKILNLLSSQLAISIENAKLYAELRESENRLNQFLEAMPMGVAVLDTNGQVSYLNKTGQQILGKPFLEDLKAQQIPEVYQLYLAGTQQKYPPEQLPLARALKGETSSVDNIEIHQGDQIIPLETKGTPIFDDNGKVIYAINAFQDITERKQREAERIRFIQEREAKNAALQINQKLQQEIQERERAEKDLEKANQELSRLAVLDSLTQIANRRRLDEYLRLEWQRMRREQKPLAFILCDIDYFKRYNDTYGHQAGDECLQKVALAMRRAVKHPSDLLARYGGEEFAVILPNTDREGAHQVALAIQHYIQLLEIEHKQSTINQKITISIGISSTIPNWTTSSKELVKSADNALYEAKARGRNRIYQF